MTIAFPVPWIYKMIQDSPCLNTDQISSNIKSHISKFHFFFGVKLRDPIEAASSILEKQEQLPMADPKVAGMLMLWKFTLL